jgi:ParB family chromosome partitioning protein
MERRLGRGLESLLGGTTQAKTADSRPEAPASELEIVRVRPNPMQPRKVFESGPLEELKDSIALHGVLQPICVRRRESGFEIIAGERRWRASRLAGLQTIPAVVLENVDDERMLELALVENLQRQDLDPMERARGFHEMQDRLSLTQDQVAQRVGLKRSTVANHIRLLELPPEVQEAVAGGVIDMGHGRALLSLPDPKAIKKMLARTVREELSVRQVERLVREAVEGPTPSAASASDEIIPRAPWMEELEGRMRRHLGTKISLQNGEGYRGRIVIQYHDREELERLSSLLGPKDEV